jgi:transposase
MTTKIANILQCYALGMEIKQISRSFELSCNTVHKYVRLFQKCGIPIKELASMPSSRIQEMFSEGISRSQIPSQRQLELEALLPEYSARLSRRGVTVKSLYKEYHKTRPLKAESDSKMATFKDSRELNTSSSTSAYTAGKAVSRHFQPTPCPWDGVPVRGIRYIHNARKMPQTPR